MLGFFFVILYITHEKEEDQINTFTLKPTQKNLRPYV